MVQLEVKTLIAGSSTRRAPLRLLAGAAVATIAAALSDASTAAGSRCFIRGKRCRYDRQCCTRNCRVGWCR